MTGLSDHDGRNTHSVIVSFGNPSPFVDLAFRSLGWTGILFIMWTVLFALAQLSKGPWQKRLEVLAALSVLFSFLSVYAIATPTTIMILVAVQQVIVNAFLHFAVGHERPQVIFGIGNPHLV
jgi:hypothetical protein